MEINGNFNRKQIKNLSQETLVYYIIGIQEQARIYLSQIECLQNQISEAQNVIDKLQELQTVARHQIEIKSNHMCEAS